jgi:N-acetylated-alpha-linked acidic dipeptidase
MLQARILAALAVGLLGTGAPTRGISRDREALLATFDASISAGDQLRWLEDFASAPNHGGSPHDRANAETTLALFRQWGWSAHIEAFPIVFPTPISTSIELLTASGTVRLGGQEPPVAADPGSTALQAGLPPYLAYQGDGDVSAPLVYVNYGMPADYDALARRGIDVRGKIVLARYGGGWRGLKPKLAQEHGAVGCLIYSDPADDGYAVADAYPAGSGRPPGGVQRGSVLDVSIYPGDPLSADAGGRGLTRETSPTIVKVPALPISSADARRLLAGLRGLVVPPAMRGGLDLAYHWGATDDVKVHLAIKSDWSPKMFYDVIAVLKGNARPDEWVIRANHRDGWVAGAEDPLTGHGAMLSEAKALGALAARGWRPERTIVYASWDGEEGGLLGSTAWATAHAAELRRKALVYLNSDANGRGFLDAYGSPEMTHIVNEAARDVVDPETGVSVLDRLRAQVAVDHHERPGSVPAWLAQAATSGGDLPLTPLGSGSDFTTFLQHLGIAAINIGFGGEDGGASSYHSLYDSYAHVVRFDDPGLRYAATLSKLMGRLVLGLADTRLAAARYTDLATAVARYLSEVERLATDQRRLDLSRIALTRDGAFRLASRVTDPTTAPAEMPPTPAFDLRPLAVASARLTRAAAAADGALANFASLPAPKRASLSAALRDIDQLLLDPRGLPLRPWYRNMISAPGRYTGYESKTLPGVREAIEERRFGDVDLEILKVATVLNAYADRLDRAIGAAGFAPAGERVR